MTKSIGVIGGGQLARMMIAPAQALEIDIKVLAELEGSPAREAATQVGDYTDLAIVREFAKSVDVITFDHEHVPLQVLEALEAEGFKVEPSSKALRFAQNKLDMRSKLTELGVPSPKWAKVDSSAQLDQFINSNGGVAILKKPTGGYDGKGVRVVRSSADALDWLSTKQPLLVEEKVNFVRELAQLSARNRSSSWVSWALVETVQKDGVCAEVLSPATNSNAELAAEIAKTIAEGLDVTGVLAVELFETPQGELLVNELAMRPHNSGHFTIEGSVTSQFEQHLRAVLDMTLGSSNPTQSYAVMINLLGQDDANTFGSDNRYVDGASVHVYGKSPRAGRKMGHVTALSNLSLAEARQIALGVWNGLQA